MSDPLASTLAELRRRLEAEPAGEPEPGEPAAAGEAAGTDLWQLSEMELDRLMGRRLEELHRLLPPDPDLPVPPQSLPRRLRRRLALWVQRLLLLISGPQWHLNALLTELGLATYVRHRLQEERQDELGRRLARIEEELVLLRRRLDAGPAEAPPAAG
jgi:hypothetical protein